MQKVIVTIDHAAADEKRAAIAKVIADKLGVLLDDVLVVPPGVSVSIVDIPDELTKAREKKDAPAAPAAPRAQHKAKEWA